jgi:hypothetical protein
VLGSIARPKDNTFSAAVGTTMEKLKFSQYRVNIFGKYAQGANSIRECGRAEVY